MNSKPALELVGQQVKSELTRRSVGKPTPTPTSALGILGIRLSSSITKQE